MSLGSLPSKGWASVLSVTTRLSFAGRRGSLETLNPKTLLKTPSFVPDLEELLGGGGGQALSFLGLK